MTRQPAKTTDPEAHHERARNLGLYGLLAHWDEVQSQDWLPWVLETEEAERRRRSLERRIHNARVGAFKPAPRSMNSSPCSSSTRAPTSFCSDPMASVKR